MTRRNWNRFAVLFIGISLNTLCYANVKDGFYAGAGIGGSFDRFKLTTQSPVTGFTIYSPPQNESTFMGDVFLGYGGTSMHGFYLGAELGTYFPQRTGTVKNRPGVTLSQTRFTNIMRIRDYLTADLLPGYRFNQQWLVRARLGAAYANSKFRQLATASSSQTDNQEKIVGGRIGAGIDFAYTNQLSIGIDYFHTQYREMSTVSAHPFNTRFRQKVSSNFVGVSASYTFAEKFSK
ncbi:outer membrane protein [Legionella clemsonensis]|uniref:OmpA-like transmembrane domain protein n=1 Tax=Legionella clemsonensis TaxID=1867846 RepID=A0A222P614_9GAMM|nr:outer membrane beta-barrel protein [Legionella clemsonensis]ASQ47300.1 OmpA-like transmembrane domain protein [Legionella clemsonensis]